MLIELGEFTHLDEEAWEGDRSFMSDLQCFKQLISAIHVPRLQIMQNYLYRPTKHTL